MSNDRSEGCEDLDAPLSTKQGAVRDEMWDARRRMRAEHREILNFYEYRCYRYYGYLK